MTTLTPSLEERIDRLTAQVSLLTDELHRRQAQQDRWAELMGDLTPVASDAVQRIGAELDASGLTADEIGGFLRTLAEALPDLRATLAQVGLVADLARTVTPLARPAMDGLGDRMNELDQRGYFEFVRSTAGVADKVVAAFDADDVDALGDNIVLILNTVKEMTQPEVMQMLQRTMHTVQAAEPEEPPSLLGIVRQLRDPQVRLGLGRVLTALRSVGAPSPGLYEPSDQ